MSNAIAHYKETDLHAPVAKWLENQGCHVQAEVKDIDLVGIYKEELSIAVELKKNLNLEVIGQAVERQTRADVVYIAVIEQKQMKRKKRFKSTVNILKRLNIGLLLIDFLENDLPAVVTPYLLPDYPCDTKRLKRPVASKKKKMLEEFKARKLSVNTGGSTRQKTMTVYKENMYEMARQIQQLEIAAPKALLIEGMNASAVRNALQKNYYGWFVRVERGKYQLTALGKKALEDFEQMYARDLKDAVQEKIE
jgi:hypothetical protein